MYSPNSSCVVEAAGNQSHPSWQNNRWYMGPQTMVNLPSYCKGSNFGPNDGNHPLSLYCWSRRWRWLSSHDLKKCYVTSCDYMKCERQAYLNTSSGHDFARSISLTIVLVPNCLIQRTLILYWNMSDIKKYLCHLNQSSQPCSHICQHGQDAISVLLLLHIGNETLTLKGYSWK